MSLAAPPLHPPITLYQRLRPLLALSRNALRGREQLRVGDLLDALGSDGVVVVAMVIALPFISPLSLGPIATPASLFLLFVGWRMTRGDAAFRPPKRWRDLALPRPFIRVMRMLLIRLPLRRGWRKSPLAPAPNRDFTQATGVGVATGAILLGVPIPLLPLTNTFPALAIVAFLMGWLFHNQRFLFAGWVFNTLGALVFLFLAAMILALGFEGLQFLL